MLIGVVGTFCWGSTGAGSIRSATTIDGGAAMVASSPMSAQAAPAAPGPGTNAGITGTITDAAGAGVTAATIQVSGAGGVGQSATTDANGQYSLNGLDAGAYHVSVVTKGTKAFDADVVLSPSQMLTLGAGVTDTINAPTADPSIKGAVIGTVMDQAGAAAGGTTVQVTGAGGITQTFPVDAQGQYAATDLGAGTYKVAIIVGGVKIFSANVGLYVGQVVTLSVAGPLVAQKEAPRADASTAVAEAPAPAPVVQAATSGGPGAGKISGSVTDQTGAVVVGATVKATNGTGASQSANSDEKGAYSLKGLAPGSYTLTVTAPGFKPFQADHVSVGTEELPIDATLEPAGEKTEVNVEGSKVASVETETAEVSGTITSKEVVSLGLNGRNFTQLITLAPGVSNQTGQDEAKVGVQGSVKYSVNGGRVEYNSFEVDGSDVLNAGLTGAESTLMVYPSLDAIQEVKVLTSNYGAPYGRTASGSVQVTTKSGGDKWHGNAYEFIRNEFFNARNYFDQTTKAPLYRRNDFGGTIGGPLKIPGHQNKTFVFFSEEARIEKSPSELQPNFNHAVPTLAERQGNFSDVCPNPYDPADLAKLTSPQFGQYLFPIASYPDCPRVPLPSINVPAGKGLLFSSLNAQTGAITYNMLTNPLIVSNGANNLNAGLDPVALSILNQNLIPLPNSATGCNSSLVGQVDHTTGQPIMPCYDAVISEPTHWREELFRLDHTINSKLQTTFRYIHDSWNTVTATPNFGTVRNTFPTVQNDFTGPGTDVLIRLTQTITPSLLNETSFSFSNSHITLTDVNGPGGANFQRPAGLGNPNQVGKCTVPVSGVSSCPMGYLFNNGFGGKLPGLVVGGDNQEYGGAGFTVDPSYMPWEHTNPTYNIRDDFSKALGRHTLQFGVQYVIAHKNETNGALEAATGDVQGLLTVSNVNGGVFNTGNAFANFLYNEGYTQSTAAYTGGGNAIQSFTQDSAQLRYYNRYQIIEPYVQDNLRVNSRLTVNAGVRFSLFGAYHEKYLRAYNWEPSAFSQSLASTVQVDPITGQLLEYYSTRIPQVGSSVGAPIPQLGSPVGTPIPLNLNNPDPRLLNGIVRCGVNGVPAGCTNNDFFNPAPRIGFAWDPKGDGKTSVRAGYGIFFEHGTGDEANTGSLEGSAPLVLSMTQPFPVSYACIGNYGKDCNSLDVLGQTGISEPGAFPLNFTSVPTQTKYSYSQQWSLSVERQLPSNFVTTVAYVGSKGTHLTVERQLNQLAPVPANENPFGLNEPILTTAGDCNNVNGGGGVVNNAIFVLQNGVVVTQKNPAWINLQVACQGYSAGSLVGPSLPVVNTFRPYPGIGEIFSLQNGADSLYNALQTTLRRTKGPLTVGVAYTYSHSLDDSSDRTDPTFVNSLDLRSNKASSDFDQRHLLNISYVYSLPKLSQVFQDWTSDVSSNETSGSGTTTAMPRSPGRAARLIGDGWQWSGITTFQTGTPFSVINNAGTAGIGVLDNAGVANGIGAGSYPDLAINPAPPALKSNPSSFGPLLGNPNEFVAPRGLTFGDAGRNFLNNPSRLNFDMSLLKHFPIHEGSEVEFRAEAFNVFNHTQFRIFDPALGNTGSNTVSCYGGPNYSAGAYFPGGTDCLTGNAFLHPVDAHRPRTMQFAIKYSF
jgi:hypothetical protein